MKKHGFTLFELLLGLSIALILLAAIIPGFQHFRSRNQTVQIVDHISAAIHMARSAAIAANEVVIFCGTGDQEYCDGNWSRGELIMQEFDRQILRYFTGVIPEGDHLLWRSSLSDNNELKLAPSGFTKGQRGSFYYCPRYHSEKYGAKIVISDSARLRVEYGGEELQQICEG